MLRPLSWLATYASGEAMSESTSRFEQIDQQRLSEFSLLHGAVPIAGLRRNGEFFLRGVDSPLRVMLCFGGSGVSLSDLASQEFDLIQYKEAHEDISIARGSARRCGNSIDSYNIGYKYSGRRHNDIELNVCIIMSFSASGASMSCRVVSSEELDARLDVPGLFSGGTLKIGAKAVTWNIPLPLPKELS